MDIDWSSSRVSVEVGARHCKILCTVVLRNFAKELWGCLDNPIQTPCSYSTFSIDNVHV